MGNEPRDSLDTLAVDAEIFTCQAATDEAVAAGVFGAPTFIVHADVGDLLYWGADRLELALLAASGDARAYPAMD